MMTIREIEEKILAHLDAQGVQAVDENGFCVCRGPNGTKCAAGCLIADEHYNPSLDVNLTVSESGVWGMLRRSGIPDCARDAVMKWQCRHDFPGNWDDAGYIGPRNFLSEEGAA